MIELLVAAVTLMTPGPQPSVDFSNFTYRVHPCAANVPVTAVVRNGRFSYFDEKMGTGFDIYVESVKEGSLRPGTRQAVVVLSCQFPVGGTAEAYAYDIRGAAATLLKKVADANWGPDWGAGPSSIKIRFANRFLYVDECGTINDCSTTKHSTYQLRGNTLTGISVKTIKTKS